MAEKRARLGLARAAARLAAQQTFVLPPLVLMTDDDRLADPVAAIRALPRGSMVIVRARDPIHRAVLASPILAIARTRKLVVLIANDPVLAARSGASGIHLPQKLAHEAQHWRALHPGWLITAASHGLMRIPPAVDAILLSPIFATQSHTSSMPLGAVKAGLIAARLQKPVYALGGIGPRNAASLCPSFAGIAAIGGLAA